MQVKMTKYRGQWQPNLEGEFFNCPLPYLDVRSLAPNLNVPTVTAELLLEIAACILPSFE